jgi:D-hydroxyproline dehydrogenase subunit beta
LSAPPDVAIIGGGIVGCAAAAFLAEAGVKVDLYERDEVGAAASGRNSGSVQHPFDPVMATLHEETLSIFRGLDEFDLPGEPAGVLMLSEDRAGLDASAREILMGAPELNPTVVDPDEARRLEPALAAGLWACRLDTGYPVRPASATRALARRAYRAGVRFHEGETAWPWIIGGRARGVLAAGVRRPAGAVLVAAGPWTPEVVDTTRAWQPILPVWGVVAEVALPDPPRHVLEETGVENVASAEDGSIFSLVPGAERSSLGSTFLPQNPDPEAWEGRLRRGGRRFVPALARAEVVGLRACARPQSLDGRPLAGELPGEEGLWVAAGHGPWGISTGPATARAVVDALLGRADVPAPLWAGRF